jgi:general secretion pathway protein H
MPTSNPGTSVRREFSGRGASSRGFSLLEIMVVVAIIGIFVGVTVLSTDLVSYERRLEQEARRVGTILDFATDEALLQSQDFGLLICEDGYHFFIYNYEIEDWLPYAADPFEDYLLDEDMLLTLRLDDNDVVLETTEEAYPENWSLPLSEEELDRMPKPQITILSSGEVTPFELGFRRASDLFEPGATLNVAFDGEYEVVRSAD